MLTVNGQGTMVIRFLTVNGQGTVTRHECRGAWRGGTRPGHTRRAGAER